MPGPCRGISVPSLPSVVLPATRENIFSASVSGDPCGPVNTLGGILRLQFKARGDVCSSPRSRPQGAESLPESALREC